MEECQCWNTKKELQRDEMMLNNMEGVTIQVADIGMYGFQPAPKTLIRALQRISHMAIAWRSGTKA
jgi:hypothetical protein